MIFFLLILFPFVVFLGVYSLSSLRSKTQNQSLKQALILWLTTIWNKSEYFLVENYWTTKFLLRKPIKQTSLIRELPLLYLLSFYTIIRTRFSILEKVIITKAVLWFVFFGNYTLLLVYSGTAVILTCLVALPPIQTHLKEVYYNDVLLDLSWNGVTKTILSQGTTGAKVLGSLTGVYIGNEVVSAGVGYMRWAKYNSGFRDSLAEVLATNEIRRIHNQPLQDLSPYDHAKAISYRTDTNVLREVLSHIPIIDSVFSSKTKK